VRTALQQRVGARLFDHLRACYTVDSCRSVGEEVIYLKAYLHQLNMELNRREEIFLDTVAKFRQMGHTHDDSEVRGTAGRRHAANKGVVSTCVNRRGCQLGRGGGSSIAIRANRDSGGR
jgi:hypothetical protein